MSDERVEPRPAFGGNVMATIACPRHRPQMSTVRPGVMKALARNARREAQVERITVAHLGVDAAAYTPNLGPRERFVFYPARGWAHL